MLGWGLIGIGAATSAYAQCQLNSPSGKIKHVIYVEFDNVHFTRDNPNVPSDLEQMPNLLNFITQNGTLDAGDHTVLISHTANDILTTATGLYSDHHGIFISNSFGVFGPGVKNLGVTQPSDFFTDHVDLRPTMIFLTGLKDDYRTDGRVILELLDRNVLPSSLDAHTDILLRLGQLYK